MSRSRIDGSAAARRAVARWAYRLVRRDWRQYTVIVVLLTVAVTASTLLATAAYNVAPAAGDAEFGDATHVLYLDGDISSGEITQWIAAGVDTFGNVDPIGHRTVAAPGTTQSVDYRAQAIDGPYSGPMLTVREGRAPSTAGEAAITDGVASMLSLTIGDTIDIDGTVRQVVGLVENPSNLKDEFVLVPPSEIANSESVAMLMDASDAQLRHFGDEIGGGIKLGERSKVPEDVLAGVLTLLASTVVLLLVALIASASFTVIAQRRIPQYGMLSAIGGSERHIRMTVLASGALIGTVAAVVGTVVGIGGWLASAPAMESLVDHRIAATNIPWWIVLTSMLLAIVAATAAAWWPARAMSRIPTVAALSGRTPQQTRPHRSALLAVALLAVGVTCLRVGSGFTDTGPSALQAAELVLGTLTVLAGVLLLCPVLIRGMGQVATALPVSGRLALRDLSRHQARSSAALAAIGLALGIPSVIVASVAAGENASPLGNLSSTQLLVHAADIDGPFADSARIAEVQSGVDALVAALGDPDFVRFDTFLDPTTPPEPRSGESLTLSIARQVDDGWEHVGTVFAATPELLAAIGVDPAEVAGGEVVTSATGELYTFGNGGAVIPDRRSVQPLTTTGTLPDTYTSLPNALLDVAQADQRGLNVVPSGLWLIENSRPLDKADIDNARDIVKRHGFRIETRDDRSNLRMIRLAAGLTGTLLALGVMAATLGLIRGESANDIRTLTAAGARPTTRRGIAAVTAGTLAGVGALLGIVSAYIGLVAGGVEHLMPLPWEDLAIIAVGAPLLATIIAWLVGGREPPAIARRPLD